MLSIAVESIALSKGVKASRHKHIKLPGTRAGGKALMHKDSRDRS